MRHLINRSLLFLPALAGGLLVASACDEEVTDPQPELDAETLELIRFTEFVTDIPAGQSLALTHDLEKARSLGLTGSFPLGDG